MLEINIYHILALSSNMIKIFVNSSIAYQIINNIKRASMLLKIKKMQQIQEKLEQTYHSSTITD